MATRRLEFHLLDRRNGLKAVKRLAYTALTDSGVFGQVVWEWFDAGQYACCDYHRAHAIYGFANANEPSDLADLRTDMPDGGEEIIVLERVIDADTGEEWTDETIPSGAYDENAASVEFGPPEERKE